MTVSGRSMSCVTSGRLTLCMTQHGLLRFHLVGLLCVRDPTRYDIQPHHHGGASVEYLRKKEVVRAFIRWKKDQEFLIHKTKNINFSCDHKHHVTINIILELLIHCMTFVFLESIDHVKPTKKPPT